MISINNTFMNVKSHGDVEQRRAGTDLFFGLPALLQLRCGSADHGQAKTTKIFVEGKAGHVVEEGGHDDK